MPPRRQTPKAAQKHELEAFAEKYDTLALLYGDPVETVFAIMSGAFHANDHDTALQAAGVLMRYRFPQVKASEGGQDKTPVMNFNVLMSPPPEKALNAEPVRQALPVRIVEAQRE
jgi:hypothetical protein